MPIDIKKDLSLKKVSYYRIGGPADFYVEVKSIDELKEALSFCKAQSVPYYIVGNMSNILFDDDGYRGMIIRLSPSGEVKVNGTARVFAGDTLHSLIVKSAEKGFGGIEKLAGIPATIGGAIRMNAGAFGQTIGDVVKSVEALTSDGKTVLYQKKNLGFDYRKSRFSDSDEVIISAELEFKKEDSKKLKETIKENLQKRKEKQPLEYPSCGSVFKNPEGFSAGKLIEDAGLKGFRIGEAQVSEKHANFIVNLGNATSKDIKSIISHIQEEVKRKFNIELEREVIYLL